MTENHFWSHFSTFQINTIFFTKLLPAAILDDRKSLWIAFLAISDQYATLIFFSPNCCWRPFWITENHFLIAFLAISEQYTTFIDFFVHKMAAGGHFGWPKITFDGIFAISDQCTIFYFVHNGCHFGWPKITFDRISRHFRSIRFFHKMAACGHFGWPKITFDRISRHFRSIRNFENLFTKWLLAAILDDRKSLFDRISRHFRSIHNFYWLFFSQNGCRRPFWLTENNFWWHFRHFRSMHILFYFFHF